MQYDLEKLHSELQKWLTNPVFPAWWDGHRIEYINTYGHILYSFDEEQCSIPKTANPANGFQIIKTAHLIGLDVESYRLDNKGGDGGAAFNEAMEKEINAQDLRTLRLECLKLAVQMAKESTSPMASEVPRMYKVLAELAGIE